MNRSKNNLTEGNLTLQILFFTLPLMGSLFIQQLYSSADLVFAGNFLGKEASAAIGGSTFLVSCMIGLFTGISTGVSILYGRATGSKKKEEKQKIFESSIWISIIGGGLMTVVVYVSTPLLLKWLRIPNEIFGVATDYLKIYFISLIPMILYNMISGIIRAAGNSKMPMVAQMISGGLNIVLDAVFVVFLGLGIKSLAVATFISQSVAALIVLSFYLKSEQHIDRRTLFRSMNVPVVKHILVLGVPVGFQHVLMSLSNVFVQFYVNQLGVDTIAAFSGYFKIGLLIYYPILAFGQANLSFVSQNIGACKIDRVNKSIRTSIVMGMLTIVPLIIVLMSYGEFFIGIFNSDPAVIAVGLKIIKFTFPFYWMYVFVEVLSYAIRGVGKTTQAMLITFFNFCIMRIVLLMLFSGFKGDQVAFIASTYPITWLMGMITVMIYWYSIKKKVLGEFLLEEPSVHITAGYTADAEQIQSV